MSPNPDHDDHVLVPPSYDEAGRRVFHHTLTAKSDTRDKVLRVRLPAVIPVIFVPGIMGTNLRLTENQKKAWRPPNVGLSAKGILEAIAAMGVWMFRGPKERQRLLNSAVVEPDPDGPISVGDAGISEKIARARNWGTVYRYAYHPVMAALQRQLNTLPSHGIAGTPWEAWAKATPADYGEERGETQPLTDEQWRHASRYRFDVWAGGYNWLQSNRDSAKDLRDYIETQVLPYYQEHDEPADKVILVTHSMGGLVSRALTQLHNYYKVLGVVHGVMPATGAPATYHHCRCGYTGASQIILGRNAGEVTAVLGNSPGGLELLPMQDYDHGRPWLFLRDGNTGLHRALPERTDAYDEIYNSREWYGLVPEANEKFLDLTSGKSTATGPVNGARDRFADSIRDVAKFHLDITKQYHDETYVHFGDDSRCHSYAKTEWSGRWQAMPRLGTASFKDDNNGRLIPEGRTSSGDALLFVDAAEAGDGTVPTLSGQAPGERVMRAVFRHGNGGKGSNNGEEGYEHQPSYNDERAQWATVYSILQIAQLADWHD